MKTLISPKNLKSQIPSHPFPIKARAEAARVLKREDPRLAVLAGPCSIHDLESAREYARRLSRLSSELKNIFLVMRVFLEKPRSRSGWKGLIYDPHLDGTNDIEEGLRMSRGFLSEMASLNVPCAAELLDPLALYYFDDLITWGLIGARTSASQPHRQMASGLSFPVGFKNDLLGQIEPALSGVLVAREPQTHIGIDDLGRAAVIETEGNPLSHIVLRGSELRSNADPLSVKKAVDLLDEHGLAPSLLIDCSHGNSGKDYERQKDVFASVVRQAAQNPSIAGAMLESHLFSGKQPLGEDPSLLYYGISITDSCLSLEETEGLLHSADEALSPISISLVQNGCSHSPSISPLSETASTR